MFDIREVPMPERALKQRISRYVSHVAKDYAEWYVGLTADPEQSLFDAHNVSRDSGAYRHFRAEDPKVARRVKRYYVEKGMCNGERSPLDLTCVYVYHTTDRTVQ